MSISAPFASVRPFKTERYELLLNDRVMPSSVTPSRTPLALVNSCAPPEAVTVPPWTMPPPTRTHEPLVLLRASVVPIAQEVHRAAVDCLDGAGIGEVIDVEWTPGDVSRDRALQQETGVRGEVVLDLARPAVDQDVGADRKDVGRGVVVKARRTGVGAEGHLTISVQGLGVGAGEVEGAVVEGVGPVAGIDYR